MTKRLSFFFFAAMIAACSDDVDPNPNASSGATQTKADTLSSSFATTCTSCHGDTGLGKAEYPKIPGTRDEASFIAIVRSGKGDMPAFAESRISDAELKADYLWLTTKRPQ